MSYDSNNIFALILRGDIPCHKISENDAALAFLDVAPRSEGHLLVIPKAPCRILEEINPESLGATMLMVQDMSALIRSALGADGVLIIQRNGTEAGQVVDHLHFHVIPCYKGQTLLPELAPQAEQTNLKNVADRLRQISGA